MPSHQPVENEWNGRIVAAAAILVPLLALFGPALASRATFVFRDAAHFYYPTFYWVDAQWRQGHIPLWNPQENTGVPAAADATSSVFYPGKLLFLLPGAFAWRYKLYIVAHVLLAASTTYYVARCWRRSHEAAAFAALAYAFGGPVFFQYCNVVFLVGATWLPLGLYFYERCLRRLDFHNAAAAGVVMALMVLGGDPQTAYHTVFAGGVLGLLGWIRRSRQAKIARSTDAPPHRRPNGRNALWWKRSSVMLGGGAAIALLLSAVQVWPSWEWSRGSTRAAYEAPRNVYEAAVVAAGSHREENQPPWAERLATVKQGLIGIPPAGSHQRQLYEFSIGPWRWAELIWPNCTGQLFPTHKRWIRALPAEGRTWTPSLYLGLPCLLLALLVAKKSDVRSRWCAWLVVIGVGASLGWFGLAWLLHEMRYALGGGSEQTINAPVGGLYWFFVVFLPGYAMFRYPAKWFVLAAFAISQLAARGVDAQGPHIESKLQRLLLGVGATSACLLAASFIFANVWTGWVQSTPGDNLFGPFDAAGALVDVRFAVLHTCVVCCLLAMLVRWNAGRFDRRWRHAVLLVCVVDLTVAQRALVPLDDRLPQQLVSVAAQRIEQHHRLQKHTESNQQAFRVFRERSDGWQPAQWANTRSARRQSEGLHWDLDTLAPRYQLLTPLTLVKSVGSLSSNDYAAVLREGFRQGAKEHAPRSLHSSLLDVLGVRYCIGAARADAQNSENQHALEMPSRNFPLGATRIMHRTGAFPRTWLVGKVEQQTKLRRPTPDEIEQRTQQIFFPRGAARDFRQGAVVEGKLEAAWLASMNTAFDARHAQCRVVRAQPNSLEIEVKIEQAALLVVSDLFYPGWTAEVEKLPSGQRRMQPILQTNRIMRGVALPAGHSRVVMRYRPWSFWGGAVLSFIAWTALAAYCFRRYRHSLITRSHA